MNLSFLKPAVLAIFLFWQAAPHPSASSEHLRYQRPILVAPSSPATQACAVLDGDVFAHASPSLKDLRLYLAKSSAAGVEVPYATTLSETLQQESEDAGLLNLGSRDGRIVFDLAMPRSPYTSVTLDLAGQDFLATADVSGRDSLTVGNPTHIGTYTLFDLTSQHLSRSTTVPLVESSYSFLHIELTVTRAPGRLPAAEAPIAPSMVKGASVPPSREAQTIYTTLQQTATLNQRGRQSVATFQIPLRVPVERISFGLDSAFKGNFSRTVEVTARVLPRSKSDPVDTSDSPVEDEAMPSNETVTGNIHRVHTVEAGHSLSDEALSIPVSIGSNMQRPAGLEVAIDNGDDAPLPIVSVGLQMRQRRICFNAAAATSPLTLFYGDSALEAPIYDYAKLFQPVASPIDASLGPETLNPAFKPRIESRPFTERHPELLWIALLAVVCILAITAIRSARKLPR